MTWSESIDPRSPSEGLPWDGCPAPASAHGGPRRVALLPRSGALLQASSVSAQQRPFRRFRGAPSTRVAPAPPPDLHIAATDGWVHLPAYAGSSSYYPDDLAPPGLTTYIFGLRDVTPITENPQALVAQRMRAQLAAPTFGMVQERPFDLKLTNLGFEIRQDLAQARGLQFHGFRRTIPIFGGAARSTRGVPVVRDLTYHYKPHHPGTFLYHCQFEDTEHLYIGLIGVCYVAPAMNDRAAGRLYAYNDPATRYDREFVISLTEVWPEAHWSESHAQSPEWSEYAPEFWLMNGRVYPDTVAPNGGGTDPVTGELIPPPGHPELQYQPISSLITCNAGDEVLLRLANLGYHEQTLRLTGVEARVIGRDATPVVALSDRHPSLLSREIVISPGESVDAIFTAPQVSTPARMILSSFHHAPPSGSRYPGYGGQMTEIHVYPAGTLAPQTQANDWGNAPGAGLPPPAWT